MRGEEMALFLASSERIATTCSGEKKPEAAGAGPLPLSNVQKCFCMQCGPCTGLSSLDVLGSHIEMCQQACHHTPCTVPPRHVSSSQDKASEPFTFLAPRADT